MSEDTKPATAVATIEREISYTPLAESEEIKLTIGVVMNTLAVKTKKGKTPSVTDVAKFMMLCKTRRLNPFAGDAYLVGYDSDDGPTFQLITAIQALRKRAEIHPQYDGCERGVIVAKGDSIIERVGTMTLPGETLVGGWAKCYRKDYRIEFYETVKLATYSTGRSRWAKDKEGMIAKCFDEQTEVLTTNGFERFADVTGQVLQVTANGLEPTDAQPFAQPYSGDMVLLDSDDLNFCVTPNHDMLTMAGKIEAGELFENARSRPKYWIPRAVRGGRPESAISDDAIKLAAIYLADGSARARQTFTVGVSRPRKIEVIERLGLHHARGVRQCKGDVAKTSSGREIITLADKTLFHFRFDLIAPLVGAGKKPHAAGIIALSQRQAALLIDTLIEFDGHENAQGVRRFYSSRPAVMAAFELASVVAGYSVSNRKQRNSDGATCVNESVTVSRRSECGVRRWGRDDRSKATNKGRYHAGMVLAQNQTDRVWCVTVPSGLIVVRRNGFSMVCGNCAEAAALRRAFPSDVGGLYVAEEFDSVERTTVKSNISDRLADLSKRPEPGTKPPEKRETVVIESGATAPAEAHSEPEMSAEPEPESDAAFAAEPSANGDQAFRELKDMLSKAMRLEDVDAVRAIIRGKQSVLTQAQWNQLAMADADQVGMIQDAEEAGK